MLDTLKFLFLIFFILKIYSGVAKKANLHTLINAILYTFILILIILLSIFSTKLITAIMPINSNISYHFLFTLITCFILFVLLFKSEIIGAIRIIDYYIHRKKVFEQGYEDVGRIVDIKSILIGKRGFRKYYLIVDYNGKKLKSLYFFNNIYSVDQDIKIMTYQNYQYVILDPTAN